MTHTTFFKLGSAIAATIMGADPGTLPSAMAKEAVLQGDEGELSDYGHPFDFAEQRRAFELRIRQHESRKYPIGRALNEQLWERTL